MILLTAVSLPAQRGRQGRGGAPAGPPPLERLTLPDGFRISVYAEGLPSARQMALGDDGTLFVGSRQARQVYAVVDRDGDHRADEVIIIATDLSQPSGLAFRDGSLYVVAVTDILRYDDIEANLDAPPEPVVVYDQIPAGRGHTWKYLGFGPDGKLYVPVGAPCNICERTDETQFASMLRMNPDGTDVEIFAKGIRNSVGFDWHPETGELWFTDNGRDGLGDDVPNDELNVAPEAGLHFGFPYCHQGNVPDPDFGATMPCSETTPPVQFMGPHVAAIGMTFYTGSMFPSAYRGAIIIAQHGSWNRSEPIGYRLMTATVEGRSVTSFDPFVTGFQEGVRGGGRRGGGGGGNVRVIGDAFARPADVMQMPDGSLLMSDDEGGRIYRIWYEGSDPLAP
jgi:glucose/arabinose dehydrogenase